MKMPKLKPISIPEPSSIADSIPKPILIPKLIPEPIPILESILELTPNLQSESAPESKSTWESSSGS